MVTAVVEGTGTIFKIAPDGRPVAGFGALTGSVFLAST